MENALCVPNRISERSKISVGCVPPDAMQLHWTGWLSKGMQFSTSLYTLDIFGGALGINGTDILIQRMSICRDYKMKMKTEINKRLGLDSLCA